ncbi:hypothetical protein HYT95_01840 [Candidatus Peregrinibacteria bacterium]|nr:hypothetical protein [Candidatus Peregrinibacteria bacterium]
MSLAEGPSPDSIGEEGQEDALSIQHKIGGKPLTECIATGSWEEQAQGHAYLFSQANAVGDTSKRHSLHLAHLASERANHTSTVIRPLSKMMRSAFCFEQMLAHKQEITKGEGIMPSSETPY